jgi:hypothetical protein
MCGWLCLLSAVLAFSLYQRTSELNKTEWKLMLADERTKIDSAQIADMEWQLSTTRKYEDGFRDAMMYSESQAFVDGYHRAIGQNTEEIARLNALLNDKSKEATASKIVEQAQP